MTAVAMPSDMFAATDIKGEETSLAEIEEGVEGRAAEEARPQLAWGRRGPASLLGSAVQLDR
jgi:hypothetical protein